MRPYAGTLIIALLLFAAGCKLPQSVFDTTKTITIKTEKAEEVCLPLINAAVKDLDIRVAKESDPTAKKSLENQKKVLIKVRSDFPKITRNLKKLLELMEKFNDIFGKEESEVVKPKPAPDSPDPAPDNVGVTP